MNKIVTFLVACSFAVQPFMVPATALAQTTTPAPSAQLVQLARFLRQGLSGDDVKTLQTLLASDLSVYPEGLVTGFFGQKTAAAVRRFQKKNGLPQVGQVGPLTLEKLKRHAENEGLSEEKDDNDDDHNGNREEKRLCVKIPPGHLIAPGWLRKHNGERPIVPECQNLPKGIRDILDNDRHGKGTSTPPVVDITAPVISGLMSTSTTANSTMIKWTTNEFSTSWVWYGTTTPFTSFDGTNLTSLDHAVNLTGLNASTTYMYVAVSKDSTGNTATSSQQSFTTN